LPSVASGFRVPTRNCGLDFFAASTVTAARRPHRHAHGLPYRHARTAEGRHSRRFLSGNPESPARGRGQAFFDSSPGQLKTLDSVSVRNSGAMLPYSSTARNDGPRHFPGRTELRRVAPGQLKTLDSGSSPGWRLGVSATEPIPAALSNCRPPARGRGQAWHLDSGIQAGMTTLRTGSLFTRPPTSKMPSRKNNPIDLIFIVHFGKIFLNSPLNPRNSPC